jgi:hypothetical protein
MLVHPYNSSTWEAETEGLQVQGQPGQHGEWKLGIQSKILSQKHQTKKEDMVHKLL